MSKDNQNKSSKGLIIVLIAVIVIMAGAILFLVVQKNKDGYNTPATDAVDWEGVSKNDNSISIPGFEMITLKANSYEQDVAFSNPPENNCYFQLTLFLEDGTQIWQSEKFEPGYNSGKMYLEKKLEAGEYKNCTLKYSCFKLDDDSAPLNGAETKLTIKVK